MQILSRVVLLLGLVILVAGLLMLGKNVIDINQLHAVANANRSTNFFNPLQQVLLMSLLTTAGGFLTGLGLSLPRRSAARAAPKP